MVHVSELWLNQIVYVFVCNNSTVELAFKIIAAYSQK